MSEFQTMGENGFHRVMIHAIPHAWYPGPPKGGGSRKSLRYGRSGLGAHRLKSHDKT